jgi:hypothetical protein
VDKLPCRLGESGVSGRVLATVLVGSTRFTIWPAYLWLSRAWGGFGFSARSVWIVSAAYFSLCVWLVVLLTRNGKQHPGIALDAICGGTLVAVAVALHQPTVQTALSQTGFGAATWVTFFSASALVLARSVERDGQKSRQQ